MEANYMNYTLYNVTVGCGNRVVRQVRVKILNGSLNMIRTIKEAVERQYGLFGWVKFEKV